MPTHGFPAYVDPIDSFACAVLLREVTHAISQRGGMRMFFPQVLEGHEKSDWPESRVMAETRERVMTDVVGHFQAQEARQWTGHLAKAC